MAWSAGSFAAPRVDAAHGSVSDVADKRGDVPVLHSLSRVVVDGIRDGVPQRRLIQRRSPVFANPRGQLADVVAAGVVLVEREHHALDVLCDGVECVQWRSLRGERWGGWSGEWSPICVMR